MNSCKNTGIYSTFAVSSMLALTSLGQSICDPRIATHVVSAGAAFVVGHDGSLRFANYTALRLMGAETWADASAQQDKIKPFLEIARALLSELPPDGSALTERIRFPAAGGEKTIAFSCSPIVLADGTEAVLLIGPEAGRTPDTVEAAKTLFDGERSPILLSDLEGKPVYTNPSASVLFGAANNLAEVLPGATSAIARARSEGAAEFPFGVLKIFIRRIEGAEPMLLALVAEPVRQKPAKEPTGPAPAAEAEPEAIPETAAGRPAAESNIAEEAAADATAIALAPAVQKPATEAKPPAVRVPSRFVWQTDSAARIVSVSPELATVVGEANAAVIGKNWSEIARNFGVTGAEAAAEAIARRDTWSGITVLWPVDETIMRPVDLAALPVFGRERNFEGYRGFGVFREAVERPAPAVEEPAAEVAASDNVPATEPSPEPAPSETLVIAEPPKNIVPLHKAPGPERPALTAGERNAFREIARVIGRRLNEDKGEQTGEPKHFGKRASDVIAITPAESKPTEAIALGEVPVIARAANGERAVLDRLPLGIVVHRGEKILYANRTLLDWVGFRTTGELDDAGGLSRLFVQGLYFSGQDSGESGRPLHLAAQGGEFPVEARLISAPWEGETALVYVLRRAGSGIDERMEAGEMALREAEATARELRAILDTATDGVALMDRSGTVLGLNRSAEALFGFESSEIEGRNFTVLFAPESHRAAMDYLDGLASNGVASVLNDGREVIGIEREGGLIPLFMTLGRVGENTGKFCAVFRDITQWKRAEEDLIHAKRHAESASTANPNF